MDLKEFTSSTLVQIVDGVLEAEEKLAGKGASVNPIGGYFDQNKVGGNTWSFKDGVAQMVEFDVALTNSEREGTKGGIGVMLGALYLD